MGNHDGKVVISTALDNSDLKKGVSDIKGSLGGLKSVTQSTSDSIQKAFTNGFSKSVAMAQAHVKDLERQFETVSAQLKDAMMADDNTAAERAGNKQIQVYDQLEAAREKLRIAVEEEARKQAEAEGKEANKAAKEQQKATRAAKKNLNTAEKSAKRFGSRLREIVTGAFVFNLISSGLRSVTDYFGRALKTNTAFSAETAKLKAALLTAYQPIYTYVVPALTTLMRFLTVATQYVAQFFSALGGKSLKISAEAAEKLYKEAEAIESVGSAVKDTGKALAGFDEINTLQNEGAQGGGSSVSTTAPDFSSIEETEAPAAFEKFLEKANKQIGIVKENFQDAFIADVPKLKKKWKELLDAVKETFSDDNVQEAFSSFETQSYETAGKVVGAASSIATSFADGVVSGVSDATGELKDFNKVKLTSITGNLTNVEDTAGELAKSCADIATAFDGADFSGIVELCSMLIDLVGMETLDEITGFLSDLTDYRLEPITENSDKIKAILERILEITNLLVSPVKKLVDKISEHIRPYKDTIIHQFFEDLTAYNTKKLGDVLDDIIEFLDGVIAFITGDYDFEEWFNADVAPWFTKEKWKSLAEEAKEGLKGKWAEIGAILTNPLSLLPEQFRSVFKDAVNKAITVLNQFIAQVNKSLSFTIPGFTWQGQKKWDAKKISLGQIPSVPYLAQGAVLPPNKPFMAVVGDQKNGTNIEAPLSTIQEALANVLASQGSGDITINFTGDLAQLARVLKPVIEKEGKRVGTGMVRKAGT